jgi:putative membrane protein
LKKLKLLSIVLAILGVLAATLLVGWYGLDTIAHAIWSVGAGGFVLYGVWQLFLFVLLGIAWWAIMPPGYRQMPTFIWGRMVRDAAASCLPFSQVGGFMLGARAVTLHGVPAQVATISTVVDITAEFVAEILFLVVGLIILLTHDRQMNDALPISIGVAAALILGVIAMRFQHRMAAWSSRLGRRILGQWFSSGDQPLGSDDELTAIYGDTRRIAIGTALHLAGWFGKGAGNWIAFRLIGAPIDMASALAIEALLHAMLAVAVIVPGYAGVQEAGYASLGTLFGASAEMSLSVSLLRRARDLAVGIPILLFWQFIEVRRLPAKNTKL